MMVFIFLLFADFTYTAPEGRWLDYARSGALGEDRYLVVEQVGKKGEYHLGARQMILNGSGEFLYEIPEAENAWVIRNGVMGDRDAYLYQTRDSNTWFIWHPSKGAVALQFGVNV